MNANTPLLGAHIPDNFVPQLANRLWGVAIQPPGAANYSYLDGYVVALERKIAIGAFSPAHHILRTFSHLFQLVGILRQQGLNATRINLQQPVWQFAQNIQFAYQNVTINNITVYNSIDFAIHAWLLIRFNDGGEGVLLGEQRFPWNNQAQAMNIAFLANLPTIEAETYDMVFWGQPGTITKQNDPGRRVFSNILTLRDIHLLGDFIIQPTDNILQHLYVQKHRDRSHRTTVFIFFHASVLEVLRDPVSGDLRQHHALIDETLQTLSLLIPIEDAACQEWFSHYQSKVRQRAGSAIEVIDSRAASQLSAPRNVAHYNRWRQRLLVLEQEFENSSPRTISQWWRDTRKRREWCTCWIAVAALIFALISLAAGIASVITGGLSVKEAQIANTYASIASAASAANSSSSCCCPGAYYSGMTVAGNFSSQRMSTSNVDATRQGSTVTKVVTTTTTTTTTTTLPY